MPPKPNITPCGARVLVRREMSPEKVGKILVPDTARKKVCRGVVLAVGEGDMPPGWGSGSLDKDGGAVKPSLVGRTVIISQYAGSSLPDDMNENDLLVVVNAEEILAVVG